MGKMHRNEALTVDQYLEALPSDVREALQRIRTIVKSMVPGARERVAYGIPVMSYHYDLVGFASQKNHCSFYTMSPLLVSKMKDELKEVKVTGATLHFQADRPLPETLIAKIVRERIGEQEERLKNRRK